MGGSISCLRPIFCAPPWESPEITEMTRRLNRLFDLAVPHLEQMLVSHQQNKQFCEEMANVDREIHQIDEQDETLRADYARAHEMHHSVECLGHMMAFRVLEDRELDKVKQEEMKKASELAQLREKIILSAIQDPSPPAPVETTTGTASVSNPIQDSPSDRIAQNPPNLVPVGRADFTWAGPAFGSMLHVSKTPRSGHVMMGDLPGAKKDKWML